mmetsp:Transcript_21882/g.35221  ORF Transcript_21882/g.35221 Transcript_21882/m.35221 type:complete len:82 (-) Transcript_21882:56-301(-)
MKLRWNSVWMLDPFSEQRQLTPQLKKTAKKTALAISPCTLNIPLNQCAIARFHISKPYCTMDTNSSRDSNITVGYNCEWNC